MREGVFLVPAFHSVRQVRIYWSVVRHAPGHGENVIYVFRIRFQHRQFLCKVTVDEIGPRVLCLHHAQQLGPVGLPGHQRPEILALEQGPGVVGTRLEEQHLRPAVRPCPPERLETHVTRMPCPVISVEQ